MTRLIHITLLSLNSTLVSNELGAGNAEGARVVVWGALVVSGAELVIASGSIYACCYILGYSFSEEKEIVDYVRDMTPFLCLSIMLDSLQIVLSGSFLVLHLEGKGLRTGLIAGTAVQALSLSLITTLTNWEKQVFYFMLIYSPYNHDSV